MDTALREYPDIVKRYFGTIIPANDNKFAALNSAVWSGGSFIYVPPGVKVEMPLQAYFRINTENMGQFERTLIIADEGAQVHYIEGCSAPVYTSDSLHSAVVEIVCKKASRVTYTTIQNWSNNVYNLVTKRAYAEAEAHMEWIDGNIGSRLTMKYPAVYLMGPKASGEVLSVAYAGAGQHQDAGAKMVHAAPETTSTIISKSISKDGGRTSYRGLVRFEEGAKRSKSFVRCDALLLDEKSRSDTYPYIEFGEHDAQVGHEATISKVGDDQLFYLMSRGLSEQQAMSMIVNGFIEPVTRTLAHGVRRRMEPAHRIADGGQCRLSGRAAAVLRFQLWERRWLWPSLWWWWSWCSAWLSTPRGRSRAPAWAAAPGRRGRTTLVAVPPPPPPRAPRRPPRERSERSRERTAGAPPSRPGGSRSIPPTRTRSSATSSRSTAERRPWSCRSSTSGRSVRSLAAA